MTNSLEAQPPRAEHCPGQSNPAKLVLLVYGAWSISFFLLFLGKLFGAASTKPISVFNPSTRAPNRCTACPVDSSYYLCQVRAPGHLQTCASFETAGEINSAMSYHVVILSNGPELNEGFTLKATARLVAEPTNR